MKHSATPTSQVSITPAQIAKVRAAGKLTFRPLTDQRYRCNQLPELGILSPTRISSVRQRIRIFVRLSTPDPPRPVIIASDHRYEVIQHAKNWDYTCSGCLAQIRLPTSKMEHRCACGRLAKIEAFVVRQHDRTAAVVCPACSSNQYLSAGRRFCRNCMATLQVEQYIDPTPLIGLGSRRNLFDWL